MKWVRKYAVWIAGAAIGGFLLWLVGTAVSLQGMQGQAAGTLFGKAVPVSHYMKALQAVLHQNILSRGDRAGQPPSQQLEQQAWERLILLTEARGKGIRVSDREVVEQLQKSSLFQRNGRFDEESYQAIVQYTLGTSPRAFEEEFRESLMIWKLMKESLPEPTVTEEELREAFRKEWESKGPALKEAPPRAGAQGPALKEAPPRAGAQGPALKEAPPRAPAQGPPDEEEFAKRKEALRGELLNQKRLSGIFNWYQELFKRANLKNLLPKNPKK